MSFMKKMHYSLGVDVIACMWDVYMCTYKGIIYIDIDIDIYDRCTDVLACMVYLYVYMYVYICTYVRL